eukprot:TRINITY_DN12010_c0_g1_i1.p1 TRINITY_DN12010_c0_g1~~TRINITY_DN12010_c0_g1_i1.p1  ORF type:complete len:311 (+),score=57.39 TRINITY_DN12010_c0_g1_i1:237-1169(+)
MEILEGIEEIHSSGVTLQGGISPAQVKISRNGRIFLTPKLYEGTRFNGEPNQVSSFEDLGLSSFGGLENQNAARDIFDFGLVLLAAAIGGLDIVDVDEQCAKILGSIPQELLDQFKELSESKKSCCVIHQQELITHFLDNHDQSTHESLSGEKEKLTIFQVLKTFGRFSSDFIEFLCLCLQLDASSRPTAKQLLSHRFFRGCREKYESTLTLEEVLTIDYSWNQMAFTSSEEKEPALSKIEKICEGLNMVLYHCNRWFKGGQFHPNLVAIFKGNRPENKVIEDIALETGVEISFALEKLRHVYESHPEVK